MHQLSNHVYNQRTNGPVNAHLISGPNVSTKTSFAKFDIVLKRVKVNSGLSFVSTLCSLSTYCSMQFHEHRTISVVKDDF